MSPRRKAEFRSRLMEELTRQLLYAPRHKRIEHVRRAEKCHDQLDPQGEYPMDYLVYQITRYRSESQPAVALAGSALKSDLRLLIDRLSRSVGMPISPDEPIEYEQQLADRLGVSSKTITRWRKLGLRWRWVCEEGESQKRIAYTRDAVERFVAAHSDRVNRAGRFTQLTAEQRQRIVERARRIAQERDVSLFQVAQHLAKRTGRAVETIRLILEQHDAEHPRDPIFVDRTGPLDARQKRVIARAYAWGIPVSKLTARFRRTRSTIYRAIYEQRAAELRRQPLSYVSSPLFERGDADALILWPQQPVEDDNARTLGRASARQPPVEDLPAELAALYQHPPIKPELERTLFIQFNYRKYRAAQRREALDPYEPRAVDLDQIDDDLQAARALRDQLVQGNLGRVLTLARRHIVGRRDRSIAALAELLELGNRTLIEAIETFDTARGQTFESYLTWHLMRRYAERPAPAARAHRRLEGPAIVDRLEAQARELDVRLAASD